MPDLHKPPPVPAEPPPRNVEEAARVVPLRLPADESASREARQHSRALAERFGLLFGNLVLGVGGSMAAALVVGVVLWERVAPTALLGWLVAVAVVSAVRVGLFAAFRRARAERHADPRWLLAFNLTIGLSGAVWSAGACVLPAAGDLVAVVLFAFCISGLVAGTVASFSVFTSAVLSFSLPAVLPFAFSLITSDTSGAPVIGGALLGFTGIIGAVAVRVGVSLDGLLPRTRDTVDDDVSADRLDARRVDLLFRTGWLTALGALLAALLVVWALHPLLDPRLTTIWLVALAATTAYRLWSLHRYRNRADAWGSRTDYWRRTFNAPLLLGGVVWSIGAVVLPPGDSHVALTLMAMCLFGLVAGAVAAFSVRLSTVVWFAVTLVPLYSLSLVVNDDPYLRALGGALFLYSGLLLVVAYRTNQVLTLGLEYETRNERLIGDLQRSNAEVAALNHTLEQRVAARTTSLRAQGDELRRTAEALRESERRYREIIDSTHELLHQLDARGRVVLANRTWLDTLGYTEADIAAGIDLQDVVAPAMREHCQTLLRRIMDGEQVGEFSVTLLTRAGAEVHVEGQAYRMLRADGVPSSLGMFRDVTARVRAERALQTSEARFRAVFEHGGVGVLLIDRRQSVLVANPTAAALLGVDAGEVAGRLAATLFAAPGNALFQETVTRVLQGIETRARVEVQVAGPASRTTWATVDLTGVTDQGDDGEVHHVVAMLQDVTDTRRLAEVLEHEATHDPLTDLLNRRGLEKLLRAEFAGAADGGARALLFIDLDRLRLVNDAAGHAAADVLLRRVAEIVARRTGSPDCAARQGGGEFIALVRGADDAECEQVARSIVRDIEMVAFVWEKACYRIGSSIGIASLDGADGDIDALLRSAEIACQAARQAGGSRVFWYDPARDEFRARLAERHSVTALAHAVSAQALSARSFRLYAQPIAAIGGEGVHRHFEVLVRLVDKSGQVVPAADFLPLAERYGLGRQIDMWVLETALGQLERHAERLRGRLTLSINLSGESLNDDRFLDYAEDMLRSSRAPIDSICFEITEMVALSNFDRVAAFVHRLRGSGCRVALDDFGSGFSSFGYLREIDFDYLKIDGAFVHDIDTNPVDQTIVRSMRDIAHTLGQRTIAEFVERESQLDVLRRLGIDYAQGLHVGAPRPIEAAIGDLLDERAGA